MIRHVKWDVSDVLGTIIARYALPAANMIHMGASSNSTLLLAPTPLPHKGRLNDVKYEMAQLGINVLGKSETRRPGEGDYKSDGFTITHAEKKDSKK